MVKKRTVIIECRVQSSFTPQCTWFKETKAIKEDSNHTVQIEQTKEVTNKQTIPFKKIKSFIYSF